MADRLNLLPVQTGVIEAVRSVTGGGFDADAFHVMNRRDNVLIEEEIMHGAGSNKFVYDFTVSGKQVSGVSVVGARQLASHYGGMKHRLISSAEKRGPLFTFTSYPQPGMAMSVSAQVIPELAHEDDFYQVLVEVDDIKSGNSLQVEVTELRFESRRDGSKYERPHFQRIAQSKAYRNGVTSLIPQDVVIRWKLEMLKLSKTDEITDDVLSEKRSGILRYAASKAISIDRDGVMELTFDQIAGLSDAARTGNLTAFAHAAVALNIATGEVVEGGETSKPAETAKPTATEKPKTTSKPRGTTAAPDGPQVQDGDPGHGERIPTPTKTPSPTQSATPKPTATAAPVAQDSMFPE